MNGVSVTERGKSPTTGALCISIYSATIVTRKWSRDCLRADCESRGLTVLANSWPALRAQINVALEGTRDAELGWFSVPNRSAYLYPHEAA